MGSMEAMKEGSKDDTDRMMHRVGIKLVAGRNRRQGSVSWTFVRISFTN